MTPPTAIPPAAEGVFVRQPVAVRRGLCGSAEIGREGPEPGQRVSRSPLRTSRRRLTPRSSPTIFLLGHSEGSLHASSAAIAKQADPRFGGFISLSGPARSLLDTAIEQIRAIRSKAGSDAAVVDPIDEHRPSRHGYEHPCYSRTDLVQCARERRVHS